MRGQREISTSLDQRSRSHASPDGGKLVRALADLAAARQELETVYAALDNVHNGLLLLDGDLRATYSNPAMHLLFKSNNPENIRKTRPLYADLQKEAVASHSVEADENVARRLAWVTSGDPTPMDIPMTNGTVLRCHLAILPGNGRMLIYSDVTDIVHNAKEMERLATIDGMTGIYNRRHFLTLADHEWNRAWRYGRSLSLLMIDIDHFKAINDRFGHEVGDRAIIHVAKLAHNCKRTSDVLARIGGEEFALLLPETDMLQAQAVAHQLCRDVSEHPLVEGAIFATVSIGVAVADEKMSGLPDLMKMADQALYGAKRGGRNRVVSGLPSCEAPGLSATANTDQQPSEVVKI